LFFFSEETTLALAFFQFGQPFVYLTQPLGHDAHTDYDTEAEAHEANQDQNSHKASFSFTVVVIAVKHVRDSALDWLIRAFFRGLGFLLWWAVQKP
jgi:hypothetical protein